MLGLVGTLFVWTRRQLGVLAVNEKVSAQLAYLDAILTRMENADRHRRNRRRF